MVGMVILAGRHWWNGQQDDQLGKKAFQESGELVRELKLRKMRLINSLFGRLLGKRCGERRISGKKGEIKSGFLFNEEKRHMTAAINEEQGKRPGGLKN